MNRYQETFETWNQLAAAYRDRFMDFDLYNSTYDFLCEELINGASVLELGSGPGIIGKYLFQKRPDLQLLLTDVAPNMVKIAKEEVPLARTMVLDARETTKISERFDAIVAGFIVPYLAAPDVTQLMIELNERLNKGGWLYFSFVPGNSSQSGFIYGSTGRRTYFYYHSEAFLKTLLRNHGFTLRREWRFSYSRSDGQEEIHYVMIAQSIFEK